MAASGGTTITVCPSGPPACDFPTIQQGLQAAAAGDTVLVAPGEYLGPIELESRVTLRSSHGEEVTVILADTGPIVHAQDVVSATLEGISIDGPSTVSEAIGIQMLDSQLSIHSIAESTISKVPMQLDIAPTRLGCNRYSLPWQWSS